jgi:predicted alpha-1,6-mannanase (GH76 family)
MLSTLFFLLFCAVVSGSSLYCPPQQFSCAPTTVCSVQAPDSASCACLAASALQRVYCDDWFESWLPSMWQTAVGIECMSNYAAYGAPLTNRSAVLAAVKRVASAKDSILLIAEDPDAYDDLLWFSIAFARLYELSGDPVDLQQAQTVFDYVYGQSWDTAACGGGFYWSASRDYKNAITNELGIVAAYRLAKLLGPSSRYGAIGDTALAWFLGSGMINAHGLVNDGLFMQNCSNNGQTPWTYNQGVIYLGLAYGAERQPRNATQYAKLAQHMFAAVASRLTNANGVLVEALPGDPYNDSDQFVFKGIYVRYLRYLRDAMHSLLPAAFVRAVDRFLATQKTNAIANDMQNSLYGAFWEGPFNGRFNNKTGATQISAVDMLVANL